MVIFKKEPAVTRLSVISTQALAESRGGREREREEEEEEEEEEEPRVMEGSVSTTVARYIDRTYDLLSSPSTAEALSRVAAVFEVVRAGVLVPLLKVAVVLCLIMSVMLVIEKLSMAIIALYVKVFRRTPEKIYKWAPLSQDPELGSLSHPMVLIQIPMFNEREVSLLSTLTTHRVPPAPPPPPPHNAPSLPLAHTGTRATIVCCCKFLADTTV
ncbi:Glucomannan 4-beta-mannosyltransferase [Musa troglodytarum]|uniref:Glucomannan 4-beta-mannosyltransferase n=1 Tax=Musa troglodytarum TaxID=320322 RepID=A0A9E7EJ66_9LILI|nr:Glucomannan 4-beta-mannosyltransferase [Musa troglodytarum]